MNAIRTKPTPMLLLGIGNDGRADDGLGWRFAERVLNQFGDKISVEFRYQLQVEDAELISHYQQVVFVDATETHHPKGFLLEPCQPGESYFYSSHIQSPEAILYLCSSLYHVQPEAWLMSITGVEWMLGQAMSAGALCNLEAAYEGWSMFFMRQNQPSKINI